MLSRKLLVKVCPFFFVVPADLALPPSLASHTHTHTCKHTQTESWTSVAQAGPAVAVDAHRPLSRESDDRL